MKGEENSQSRICVIVLGMHRSGTSAVAGCLSRIGIEFGDKLLSPEPYNPRGFYEHVDILAINEEILRMFNSSFDDILPLPQNWHRSEFLLPFKDKLIEIINRDFKEADVFGFKDPRVSILLPFYLEVIKEMKLDARFVICIRPEMEIALSLKERTNTSLYKALLLINKYKSAIEEGILGQKYVRVPMDRLLKDPLDTLNNVITDLDLPIKITHDDMKKVKEFLDISLKHHTFREADALLELARMLEESETEKNILEKRFEDHASLIGHLNEQNHRLNNILAHRNHRIQFLEKETAKFSGIDVARYKNIESELDRLKETLASIKRSFSWKILLVFQKMMDTLIPSRSMLRRPYVKLLRKLQGLGKKKLGTSELLKIEQKSIAVRVLPKPVDILFVNHEESLTGAPKIIFEIAKEAMNTYSIAVISKQKGGMTDEYREAFGDRLFYPHEILDETERHRMARNMLTLLRPKLVYVNSIISYEYAAEAKKLGIPVILHIHEMASAYDVAVAEESHAEFPEFADVFFAVSEVTKRDLVEIMKVPKEKIRLIHEFIDSDCVRSLSTSESRGEVEDILGITSEDILIVSMGTFDRRKGADYFTKIAGILEKQEAPGKAKIKMLWIGRRPHDHELFCSTFDQSRQWFLHVTETKNPFPFLARADIFFLPSREDPFPLVVLEAMALKKPVVAFKGSGGAEEAAGDSITLIDNWDTDKAAKSLYNLGMDKPQRDELGSSGHIRQDLYEKRAQMNKIFEEIRKIIPKSHASKDIPNK